MLEAKVLLVVALIVLVTSTVKGLTGFGFALTSLPLFSLFIPPKVAVPITVCSIYLDGYTLYEARKSVQYREILMLVISGIIGMILGTYFLVSLDSQTLRLTIGIVTALFAALSMMGVGWEITNTKLASIPVGFISGVLGGSMSISGPPIVLFFNNQRVEKTIFRANMIAYFFSLYIATVPGYVLGNLITIDLLTSSAVLAPIIVLGATLGIRLSRRVNEDFFRRITLLLVLTTGILAILSALNIA